MATKNLKNELGRSMTEMLGTLAIIGVLSVGSISGYSYGMDRYRANETINDVNLRGIDLVRQVAMNQPLSLSEWPTVSKAGYDISEPVLSAEGDAYFTISGVPKRVCEMVYEGIQNNQTTDVEVNGYLVDDVSDCGDDNTMGFFFGKMVNAQQVCTTDAECGDEECVRCVEGVCDTSVLNGADCGEGLGVCIDGACATDCEWSGWFDRRRPDDTEDGADFESVTGICNNGVAKDIMCRAALFPDVPLEELGQKITCDLTNGLICYNKDQSIPVAHPACLNYEIKVLCCPLK